MPLEHLDRPSMRAVASGSEPPLVLVIEDDPDQQRLIVEQLERSGYRVEAVASAAAVERMLGSVHPDAAIVDLGLADADGVDLCRRIATWPGCPVLVLSGDHDDDRIVAAFDAGACDCVTLPYSEAVLYARLRAALRGRDPAQRAIVAEVLQVGGLVLDVGAHQAFLDGMPIDLHARPFAVLEVLMRHEGRLVPLATLVGRGRGDTPTAAELRALRIVISRIRKAIGEGPNRPVLVTEQRVGYRLAEPPRPVDLATVNDDLQPALQSIRAMVDDLIAVETDERRVFKLRDVAAEAARIDRLVADLLDARGNHPGDLPNA